MCGSDIILTYENVTLLSSVGFEYEWGYPKSINCTRTIEASPNMTVELVADIFRLESDPRFERLVKMFNFRVQYGFSIH